MMSNQYFLKPVFKPEDQSLNLLTHRDFKKWAAILQTKIKCIV